MADLRESIKVALRVTSDAYDPEIDALIAAAKADLMRVGVPREMLYDATADPLCASAIILFCKSRFGYDNDDAERFESAYRQVLKDIRNAPTTYPGARDEVE